MVEVPSLLVSIFSTSLLVNIFSLLVNNAEAFVIAPPWADDSANPCSEVSFFFSRKIQSADQFLPLNTIRSNMP